VTRNDESAAQLILNSALGQNIKERLREHAEQKGTGPPLRQIDLAGINHFVVLWPT